MALPADNNPVALKEPSPLVELSGHDVVLVVDFHLKHISVKLQLELHVSFGKEVPVRFLDVPVPVAIVLKRCGSPIPLVSESNA